MGDNKTAVNSNSNNNPPGKSRLITLGLIAAAFVMAAVFMLGYMVGTNNSSGLTLPVSASGELFAPKTPVVIDESNPHFTADGKLRINLATVEELTKLPGVGTSTAEKIIEYREKNNGFSATAELLWVSGIGQAKYAKIKPLITIS